MNLFWILYIIFIPITFILCWMSTTASYNGINWKDILIGDFIFDLVLSIIPIVNMTVTLICIITLGFTTGFFDKPLFKQKNK